MIGDKTVNSEALRKMLSTTYEKIDHPALLYFRELERSSILWSRIRCTSPQGHHILQMKENWSIDPKKQQEHNRKILPLVMIIGLYWSALGLATVF